MEILFIDNRLERFCDGEYTLKLSKDIQNSLQKKVSIIDSAEDLQTLYAIRGLNFERLGGKYKGKYSIRLNDQWRLILTIQTTPTLKIIIEEIVDYH